MLWAERIPWRSLRGSATNRRLGQMVIGGSGGVVVWGWCSGGDLVFFFLSVF